MTEISALKNALLAEIPSLRAFAISLSGSGDRADDLVQETLMKAWAAHASFAEGSNLRAWLFTIMRNTYFSQYRKARREVQDTDGEAAARLVSHPEQQGHLDVEGPHRSGRGQDRPQGGAEQGPDDGRRRAHGHPPGAAPEGPTATRPETPLSPPRWHVAHRQPWPWHSAPRSRRCWTG